MTGAAEIPVLNVRGLSKVYTRRAGLFGKPVGKAALRDVSLSIGKGEIVGLVGESGSGKTTLGRTVMRLSEPSSGSIELDGLDITTLSRRALRPLRHKVQIVFQDPTASLNPRRTILQILRAPLRLRGIRDDGPIFETLSLVGLGPEVLDRRPALFSGGQRQRLSIARAVLMEPDLIIADEAVSALDVCVQAQVVNLFADLRSRLGVSVLFIGHDLAVVGALSDRIGVMFRGSLVEIGPTRALFARPRHPYTARLLAAVPREPDSGRAPRSGPSAAEAHADATPPRAGTDGCLFARFCAYAVEECRHRRPPLADLGGGHETACLRPDLVLDGVQDRRIFQEE